VSRGDRHIVDARRFLLDELEPAHRLLEMEPVAGDGALRQKTFPFVKRMVSTEVPVNWAT